MGGYTTSASTANSCASFGSYIVRAIQMPSFRPGPKPPLHGKIRGYAMYRCRIDSGPLYRSLNWRPTADLPQDVPAVYTIRRRWSNRWNNFENLLQQHCFVRHQQLYSWKDGQELNWLGGRFRVQLSLSATPCRQTFTFDFDFDFDFDLDLDFDFDLMMSVCYHFYGTLTL